MWDDLYARASAPVDRPEAEKDSVPMPSHWGSLPSSEWEANDYLTPYLAKSRRWLDLGCGTGSVTAAYLRRFPRASATGIDASAVAIDIGVRSLEVDRSLHGRLHLVVSDLRTPWHSAEHPFDCVYALFSLQFLRLGEFLALAEGLGKHSLCEGGHFAGTVRSANRSVPTSYEPCPGEPGTFVSHEPHEAGLIYRHYTAADIQAAAEVLGGAVKHLDEKQSYRAYDDAPVRAWWDFVIRVPGRR